MTKQQIEWAKQHDWYVGYVRYKATHSNNYVVVVQDTAPGSKQERMSDFSQLKAWAGY